MISSRFTSAWEFGGDFDIELLDSRPGFIVFKASGKNVDKCFENEPGGHRWQRIPPTEKRGRRHTSTITVVVLKEQKRTFDLNHRDLEWRYTRGTGAGGQHKNKTDTCVQLKHVPTGTIVRIDGRSQSTNKELALQVLEHRLAERAKEQSRQSRAATRKRQAGSGMRGDKIRTIRVYDNIVQDHKTKKKMPYKQYSRGELEPLWSDA